MLDHCWCLHLELEAGKRDSAIELLLELCLLLLDGFQVVGLIIIHHSWRTQINELFFNVFNDVLAKPVELVSVKLNLLNRRKDPFALM